MRITSTVIAGLVLLFAVPGIALNATTFEKVGSIPNEWDGGCLVAVQNGVAWVVSGTVDATLTSVDVSTPTLPKKAGACPLPALPGDLVVSNGYVYLAGKEAGVWVVDGRNPHQPALIDTVSLKGSAWDLAVDGGLLFAATQTSGLQVLSLEDPAHPKRVGSCPTGCPAFVVAVQNDLVVAGGPETGVTLDVSNPASPAVLGHWQMDGIPLGIEVSGPTAYLVDDRNELKVIDLTDPGNPVPIGVWASSGETVNVALNGHTAVIAGLRDGIHVLDVSKPATPFETAAAKPPANARDVALDNGYVYVIFSHHFMVFELLTP